MFLFLDSLLCSAHLCLCLSMLKFVSRYPPKVSCGRGCSFLEVAVSGGDAGSDSQHNAGLGGAPLWV